jgi:hypothetical protein
MAAMEHETEPGRPEAGSAAGQEVPAGDAASPASGTAPGPGPGPARGHGPGTGEPRVDAALRLLDRLPGLPVSEHPELFEQVHAQLTDVLGELDAGPAAGPRAG